MRTRGAARDPQDPAAGVHVPVGRPEPRKRGDQVNPLGVGNALRQHVGFIGVLDQTEPVPQPLHHGPGDEHRALQRIAGLAGAVAGQRQKQARTGVRPLPAGVDQQETPGPVCVLRLARLEARLPEESGLLVAGDPGNGNLGPGDLRVRKAHHLRRSRHFRQQGRRNIQQAQQFGVPGPVMDVEHQRTRGIRVIRDVTTAAGEPRNQPTVDRAEGQLAELRPCTQAGHLVQQPFELCPRKIGVQQQPGPFAERRLQACGLERFTYAGGTPALPDDGVVNRAQGALVPDHGGFALVGDTQARDAVRGECRRRQRPAHKGPHRTPDNLGVVLDPARPWIDLGKLGVGVRHDASGRVDDQNARSGRPLVDGHDVLFHGYFS